MFNSNDKQAELFNDLPQGAKKRKKKAFVLGRIALSLSYENIVVLAIGLIMLLIVFYSLGVERGKNLAQFKSDVYQAEETQMEKKPAKKSPDETEQKKIRTKVASTKYTIQVATFRKVSFVNQEVQRLKKNGFSPFVVSRGKFSEICVGDYKDRNEASSDLRKLKNLYADCYMRNK